MRALVLDLDGTLLHDRGECAALLADLFRTVAGEVREGWVETDDERFVELFETCEPSPYRRAFAAVGDGIEPKACVDALRELEIQLSQPPKNARADLERLAEPYRLGVLTNGIGEWQRRKLRATGLATYFDTVVASADVGAHKPSSVPYRTVEQGMPAEDFAMVGDRDADVDGAREVGWTAHRYTGDGFGERPETLDWG